MNDRKLAVWEVDDARRVEIHYVRFDGVKDNIPKPHFGSLDDLIGEHIPLMKKLVGDAFSPAVYEEGATRGNQGVSEITALVFDLDDLDGGQWKKVLENAKSYAYVFWTTFKHLQDDYGERYRLLLPVTRPITPREFRTVWGAVNNMLGGLADKSTKDAARLHLLPATDPSRMEDARIEWHQGLRIDVDRVLSEAPVTFGSRANGKASATRAGLSGGSVGVPMEAVLAHYKIAPQDNPNSKVPCPIPDHPDNVPSFRIDGERWICTCSDSAWKDAEQLIYRLEGGKKDYADSDIWDKVQGISLQLGGNGARLGGQGKGPSQSEILVDIASRDELFHSPDDNTYATVQADGHRETWSIGSRGYRNWLVHRFYKDTGKGPNNNALREALNTIEAIAKIDGPEFEVFTRFAKLGDTIYLDLADSVWSAIEITNNGWQLLENPPVKFRRPKGMAPLPLPVRGGSLDDLRPLINAPEEETWQLIVGWLVGAMQPEGPFPLLILQGEHGSTKSTTARFLRKLIDPASAPLRTIPRDERDLMIAATNGWALAFDNLSFIKPWLSDAFCRLATGGGFATRQLYTDSEEVIFDAMRPIILNGIADIAYRNDLVDRAITVTLPNLNEADRVEESALRRTFGNLQPGIMGALLDAVSTALRNFSEVQIEALPRMADFAHWVVAAEPSLPWEPGGFMEAYEANREEAIVVALESDPVAEAVRELLDANLIWVGTMAQLLEELRVGLSDDVKRSKSWPRNARSLSGRIRRAAPFLRTVGIEFKTLPREPGTGQRFIELELVEQATGNGLPRDSPQTQPTKDEGDANPGLVTQSILEPSHGKRPSEGVCDGRDGRDAKNHLHSSREDETHGIRHKQLTHAERIEFDKGLERRMLQNYRELVKETSRG